MIDQETEAKPESHPRAWRVVDRELFQFATTDLHELRIAIMVVFDESSSLQPSLGFDHIIAGLRGQGWDEAIDEVQLRSSLKTLVDWRLLDATQDHSARYATPEEFERRNLQWSLTSRGQAAIAGFQKALDVLRSTVSLQPAALDAIAEGLADLRKMVAGGAVATRITTRLAEVEQHHEALVENVRRFGGQLQRLLRDDAVTDDVFMDVKRRTVAYLKEYVRDVERPSRRVARNVRALESVGIEDVHAAALAGANLAPSPNHDPTVIWLEKRRRRWRALAAWFAPASNETARIESVRRIADHAIISLLRVLDRRWEARGRSASIERDFKQLANWFGATESEEAAHELFHAAFGLWPARHADLVQGEVLVARDASWSECEPVAVAASLRKSGSLSHRGRPPAVLDPSRLRARRQRQEVAALEQAARLRERLATDGVVTLSSFEKLPRSPLAELLALIGQALSSQPRSDGTRRAETSDALIEIVLGPAAPGAPPARLESEDGVLLAPDYTVSIRVLGRDLLGSREAEPDV